MQDLDVKKYQYLMPYKASYKATSPPNRKAALSEASIDNGAHSIEKLLLKIQVSEILHSEVNY